MTDDRAFEDGASQGMNAPGLRTRSALAVRGTPTCIRAEGAVNATVAPLVIRQASLSLARGDVTHVPKEIADWIEF